MTYVPGDMLVVNDPAHALMLTSRKVSHRRIERYVKLDKGDLVMVLARVWQLYDSDVLLHMRTQSFVLSPGDYLLDAV